MSETWIQVITIISVNIALFGALIGIVVWLMSKLDTDVKSICTRMDKMDSRFDGHAQRIDQLYRMFVDLLKDAKNGK